MTATKISLENEIFVSALHTLACWTLGLQNATRAEFEVACGIREAVDLCMEEVEVSAATVAALRSMLELARNSDDLEIVSAFAIVSLALREL